MLRRFFLLLSVGAATLALLSGCRSERAQATFGARAESATSPQSDVDAAPAAAGCAADDLLCQEGMERLDEVLAMYESAVEHRLDSEAEPCLEQDRREFGRAVAACRDDACRAAAVIERIASLHDLQPGVTRTGWTLPVVPSLVAVLEQAPGAEAGPTGPEFEARGRLVWAEEHGEHMGIAVQAGAAHPHVFLFDMFIGPAPHHGNLLALLQSPVAPDVLVRGYRRDAPTGIPNFDADGCRWVYRLP